MAALELTAMQDAIETYIKSELDRVVRDYADGGVLMFPYCPDCRTAMEKSVVTIEGEACVVWECGCEVTP